MDTAPPPAPPAPSGASASRRQSPAAAAAPSDRPAPAAVPPLDTSAPEKGHDRRCRPVSATRSGSRSCRRRYPWPRRRRHTAVSGTDGLRTAFRTSRRPPTAPWPGTSGRSSGSSAPPGRKTLPARGTVRSRRRGTSPVPPPSDAGPMAAHNRTSVRTAAGWYRSGYRPSWSACRRTRWAGKTLPPR